MSEKETRQKLLESARKEFKEKGYVNASLRTICKNIGVTTGALYFFFKDKNDIYTAIVGDAYNAFTQVVSQCISNEESLLDLGFEGLGFCSLGKNRALVNILYDYYEESIMLFTQSQGSAYESIKKDIIKSLHTTYMEWAYKVRVSEDIEPDSYILEWCLNTMVATYVHLVLTEPDREKALDKAERSSYALYECWIKHFVEPLKGAEISK